MKRCVLVLAATVLIIFNGMAQERDSLRYRRSSLAFVPQYLAQQAIRIDWEKPITKGQHVHRLTLSPYWYSGTTDRYTFEGIPFSGTFPQEYGETQVSGFGLEVLDKYVLHYSNKELSNFYLAFGVGYHRIGLDYLNFEPVPFEEDGATLFRYDFVEQEENIDRLEVIGLFGAKVFFRGDVLFLDLFAGPVIKQSWISTESASPLAHDNNNDHGYDGVTFRLGAGLGIVIY